MNTEDTQVTEEHIAELVRRFYERAAVDKDLKDIFDAAIDDWDGHHKVLENFWSRALLNTDRYHGSPYPLHARLPLRIEQFDIWLTHFRLTAKEVLPAEAADRAIARAEHMAESFKVGMFLDYYPASTTSCPKLTD